VCIKRNDAANGKAAPRLSNPVLRPACASVGGCGRPQSRQRKCTTRLTGGTIAHIKRACQAITHEINGTQHLESDGAAFMFKYLAAAYPAGQARARKRSKVGHWCGRSYVTRTYSFFSAIGIYPSLGQSRRPPAAKLARSQPCSSFRRRPLEQSPTYDRARVDLPCIHLSCNLAADDVLHWPQQRFSAFVPAKVATFQSPEGQIFGDHSARFYACNAARVGKCAWKTCSKLEDAPGGVMPQFPDVGDAFACPPPENPVL